MVVGLLIILLAPAATGNTTDMATDLLGNEGELATVGVKLKTLVQQYAKPESIESQRPFAGRMTDGELLFLLGDYARASLVLYDLVEQRTNQREDLYPRALYYLAESLFQMGHDLAARAYFDELARAARGTHLNDAVRRLIQIADRNHHWEGIDEAIAAVARGGTLPPEIAYIRGKSLLRQGRYGDVAAALAGVAVDHPLSPKSRYLVAVAQVQLGHADRAVELFAELTRIPDTTPDAREVRELAAMDRGRILLDLGRLAEAIDSYQDVERSSSRFEEALYEVTWTYVRAAAQAEQPERRDAEYRKALKALEILLLSERETPVLPEARLLLGNIHLRLGQFDKATEVFREVVDRYGPVWQELRGLAERPEEGERLVRATAGDAGAAKEQLPPVAVSWAQGNRSLGRAKVLAGEIDQGETWIRETLAVADKILTVLDSDERVSMFPALHDAQVRMLELDNDLVAANQRLLGIERKLLRDTLDAPLREQLNKVLEERQGLEAAYQKLPKKRREYEGRLETMRQRMLAAQQQAYRLRYEIDSMQAQLRALSLWLQGHRPDLGAGVEEQVRERMQQQESVVAELATMQQDVERSITRDRDLLSVTSQEDAQEDQVRARYQATLEREREILTAAAKRAPASAAQNLAEIDRQRDRMAGFHAELEDLRARLEAQVGKRADDLRAQVLREQGLVQHHATDFTDVGRDARALVDQIALASLGQVQQQFHNIVLRADVGVVDVAWALKEQETQRINRRVDEQQRELHILDSEFSEVLEEQP